MKIAEFPQPKENLPMTERINEVSIGASKPSQPSEIFYSYTHKDEDLRDELEKHLSVLKHNGVIAG